MNTKDYKKHMFSLVEKWQQTSKTQKQFSDENGIKSSTFSYWVKRYRQLAAQPGDFVPIEVVGGSNTEQSQETTGSSREPKVELDLNTGITIRVY